MEKAKRGQYKSKNSYLTDKLRRAAGNKNIDVYFDNGLRRFLLYYRGKFNMELGRSVSSKDISRVREHFRRLRSSNRYDDVEKEIKKMDEDEKRAEEKMLEDIEHDFKGDIHYILHSPTSFILGGKGK